MFNHFYRIVTMSFSSWSQENHDDGEVEILSSFLFVANAAVTCK